MNVQRLILDTNRSRRSELTNSMEVDAVLDPNRQTVSLSIKGRGKCIFLDKVVINDKEEEVEWPLRTEICMNPGATRVHKLSLPSEDVFRSIHGVFRLDRFLGAIQVEIHYSIKLKKAVS
jgi:hypothetical protein